MTADQKATSSLKTSTASNLLLMAGAVSAITAEMCEGLRKPDEGHVWWGDLDVVAHPDQARLRFGVQLQTSAFFELLTVKETLELFHSFYRTRLAVPDLIARLDLTEKQNARVEGLSGGQRQRLALAMALVNDPEVVF